MSRTWKSLFLALSLALSSSVGTLSSAQAEEGASEHGHHGGHGAVTLEEIVSGDHSKEFWGSVVNFTLLVLLLTYMGRKPLTAFLTSRREDIQRGISEAAEVKRAAEEAFNTYTERMKTLDAELAKLRKDVADAAERDRARIVAEANEGVARLKAETETIVQRQAEQLEAQIRREVVSAAAEAAERAVREVSTPEDQQRLAEAFVRELGTVASRSKEKRA
jgi:F-type H+-transporting ATPase subunit b